MIIEWSPTHKLFRPKRRRNVVGTAAVLERLARTAGEVGAGRQRNLVMTTAEFVVFATALSSRAESERFAVLAAAVRRFGAILTASVVRSNRRNLEGTAAAAEFAVFARSLRQNKGNNSFIYIDICIFIHIDPIYFYDKGQLTS